MKRKALLILAVLVILSGTAWAAVCPDITDLGGITKTGRFDPDSVAVGPDGSVYVTDNVAGRLFVFDQGGAMTGTMAVSGITSVSLDSSGYIYIGRADNVRGYYNGEVAVYDGSLNKLGVLGAGLGEFKFPASIAVDGDVIYVADSQSDNVKAYNRATLQKTLSFGGYGTVPGSLVRPMSVKVNPITGNLIVTDRALQLDPNNTWGLGAGAHMFTKSGQFVKRFVTYGYTSELGKMAVPMGLEVDKLGRIYISDYGKGDVQIFDELGNPVCSKLSTSATMYPRRMAFTIEGKLLMARVDGVKVFGVDDYVGLSVTPDDLTANTQQCGGATTAGSISVSNIGPGVLNWNITSSAAWISPSVAAGSINGRGTTNVVVNIDPAQLIEGANTAVLTVKSQGASATVTATVNVLPPSELTASPASFVFNVRGTDIPPSENMTVELTGDASGIQRWSASSNASWLSVSPSSGPSNATGMAAVGINALALMALDNGTYNGMIMVSAACSVQGAVSVPVTLNYVKGGTINVTTNTPDASFTIEGPAIYTGSGTSFTVAGAPEGNYSITFNSLSGFKSPAGSTKSVSNGGSVEFSGNYKDLRERNNIIATAGFASASEGDDIKVYDSAGALQAGIARPASKPGVRAGSVTAAGDFDGDGAIEIAAADDAGVITGYEADGSQMPGFRFRAFSYTTGMAIAAADVDGDGRSELAVGSEYSFRNRGEIRVFGYDGSAVSDTGIAFYVFSSPQPTRLALAAGDINGDGISEILTASNRPGSRMTEVRVWKVEQKSGSMVVVDSGSINAGASHGAPAIASADLDADDVDEIIVGRIVNKDRGMATITGYKADRRKIDEFNVAVADGAELSMAAGDVDFDGYADVAVGEIVKDAGSTVRVYGSGGALKAEFGAFDSVNISGARVSLGRVAN